MMPVTHLDRPRTNGRGLGVMRDHDDRLIDTFRSTLEHFEHDLGILGIQISGRLVRQNDRRAVDDRTGECDTLLFAAGKLERLVMHFVLEL